MTPAQHGGTPIREGRGRGWLPGVSLTAALAALVLVVLGGVVRVTGSGLGCPDWPLCHGRILPPWELTAVIEYTHRLVASAVVSPLVLVTAGMVWWSRRREPWLVAPASLSVVLLLGQALLGGVTVLRELPPATVAAHLALGQALLACLVLVAVAASYPRLYPRGGQGSPSLWMAEGQDGGDTPHLNPPPQGGKRTGAADPFPRLALAAVAGLYLLLLSGAYVTASGAIAACPEWPLCQGLGFPAGQLSYIHMLHRLAALVIGLFVLYVLHLGFRRRQGPRITRLLALTAAGLFAAQVLVGALMVWTGFPVALMALHLALASGTWAATVAVASLSLPALRPAVLRRMPRQGPAHA